MEPGGFSIGPAGPEDVPELLRLIRALADYEKLAHEVVATPADLHAALFGAGAVGEAYLARVDGRAVGMSVLFRNLSTFLGRPGLYLEDLFVEPACRGRGIGRALLQHAARLAVSRGCRRLDWSVLDWNTPAIEFYESVGARAIDEWTIFRLSGEALAHFAGSGPAGEE